MYRFVGTNQLNPTAKAFAGDRSTTKFIDAAAAAAEMRGTTKHDNLNLGERNPDRLRYTNKIGRILTNLVKFAVDSAVTDSSKGVSGLKKLYRIVEERFTRPPASLPLSECKKPEELKLMQKMQTKINELQEDLTELKQPDMTVSRSIDGTECEKDVRNEGIKESGVQETEKRRIFIRSRL
uniref:Uncharacterized protein MANES_03G116200 n=1 Tax=Rhizophora mucronata TaxID=61149 RepID=A0A2P2J3R5_RHIMU